MNDCISISSPTVSFDARPTEADVEAALLAAVRGVSARACVVRVAGARAARAGFARVLAGVRLRVVPRLRGVR